MRGLPPGRTAPASWWKHTSTTFIIDNHRSAFVDDEMTGIEVSFQKSSVNYRDVVFTIYMHSAQLVCPWLIRSS